MAAMVPPTRMEIGLSGILLLRRLLEAWFDG